MGRAHYNRDQRIANGILDALLDFGATDEEGAVSLHSIFRACCAGKQPHELGEWTKARTHEILKLLVEYGAVMPSYDVELESNRFFLRHENLRAARDVWRGTFLP